MIKSEIAALHVERFSGLDGFPRAAAAQKELRLALESAATPAIAESFVADWLSQHIACPKPTDIRKGLWSLGEQVRTKRAACSLCSGEGARVVFFLVTFDGMSMRPKTSERIGFEFPSDLAEKLRTRPGTQRQDIISAAELCPCVTSALRRAS